MSEISSSPIKKAEPFSPEQPTIPQAQAQSSIPPQQIRTISE